MSGSNFKDETLFLSFATIITAKNLGDGTNFYVRKRMIGTIKMSGERFVDVSIYRYLVCLLLIVTPTSTLEKVVRDEGINKTHHA